VAEKTWETQGITVGNEIEGYRFANMLGKAGNIT
jgi:hypothetical protein